MKSLTKDNTKWGVYLIGMLLLMISAVALAEERHIHINEQHLNAEEIQVIDMLFGYQVPDGFYWLDGNTGEWGHEGYAEVQGVIASIAEAVEEYQQEQQYSEEQQGYSNDTEIYDSQNGSVVSGNIGGQNCTYASAGGYTFRSCD